MQSGLFSITEFAIWLATLAVLAFVSRRSLRNPRCHGFYRFFAFIASAGVVIPNLRYWHDQMFAPQQLLSWLLLFSALGLLGNGLFLLRQHGGRRQVAPSEHFAFENTACLVETGIFRWIRHPMYSALLLFSWGVWLKHMTGLGLVLALLCTLFLWITAKIEERENQQFFGPDYASYSARTKNFIPYLF